MIILDTTAVSEPLKTATKSGGAIIGERR